MLVTTKYLVYIPLIHHSVGIPEPECITFIPVAMWHQGNCKDCKHKHLLSKFKYWFNPVCNVFLQWMILLMSAFAGWDAKEIQRPQEFLPERWLRHRPYGSIHPCASIPFSFGSRMCIGRRISEQEIYILLARVRIFLFVISNSILVNMELIKIFRWIKTARDKNIWMYVCIDCFQTLPHLQFCILAADNDVYIQDNDE